MSNNRVVLFLRNVNGESKWFEVSDVKIWIRVFWKMFTKIGCCGFTITNPLPRYFSKKKQCSMLIVDKDKSIDKKLKGDFNLENGLITRKNKENLKYI